MKHVLLTDQNGQKKLSNLYQLHRSPRIHMSEKSLIWIFSNMFFKINTQFLLIYYEKVFLSHLVWRHSYVCLNPTMP